jgi:hydrogenase maturation protease
MHRLVEAYPTYVRGLEMSGEGAALMDAWEGEQSVLVFDAAVSGGKPGGIHRLDAIQETIPRDFFCYSTHAFSVAEAIETSRVLGTLPEWLVVFGVEAADTGYGNRITPKVLPAVKHVASRAAVDIGERLGFELSKDIHHARTELD